MIYINALTQFPPATNHSFSTWLKAAVFAVFCGVLVVICLYAWRKPVYNWDMLGYMAIVLKKDQPNPDSVHAMTYRIAKEEVPAMKYGFFIGGENRKMRAKDPAFFSKYLPLYGVKPLYIESISLFYKMGIPLTKATVLPSIIFYFLTGLLVLLWLSRYFNFFIATLLALLTMCLDWAVSATGLSTPDVMSAFFILLAFYFVLEKYSILSCLCFLVIAMLARLDNIIPAFFVLSFCFLYKRKNNKIAWLPYFGSLAVLAVCYFGVTALILGSSEGWGIMYYPKLMSHHVVPGSSNAVTLKWYIGELYSHLIEGFLYTSLAWFVLLLFPILYSPGKNWRQLSERQYFALLLFVIIAARFVVFPSLQDRFNLAYYYCLVILFLQRVRQFFPAS